MVFRSGPSVRLNVALHLLGICPPYYPSGPDGTPGGQSSPGSYDLSRESTFYLYEVKVESWKSTEDDEKSILAIAEIITFYLLL